MTVSSVAPTVVVLADDLIWGTRLTAQLGAAGAAPVHVRGSAEFEAALGDARFAVVDLTARGYDGIAEIQRAVSSGARTLAVGQHDDRESRDRALAAGAEAVVAYAKLFRTGEKTLRLWMASSPPARS